MKVPTFGGTQLWADRRWRSGWRVQQNVMTGHARLLDPDDARHQTGTLLACIETMEQLAPWGEPKEHVVVVLHGLGRSRRSMAKMVGALEEAGLSTVWLDYPSTRRPLAAHIGQVIEVLEHLGGTRRVSFITHSLGGIVARGVLAHRSFPKALEAHRMVMCAPPNRGASLARLLHRKLGSMFAVVMGPVGEELAQPELTVPVPSIPFCVVAGRGAGEHGVNPLLDGLDDGIVTVEETKLDGMVEHRVVESIHTFVMDHPDAIELAVRFLGE